MKNLIDSFHYYWQQLFEACLPSLCLLCYLPSKGSLICEHCNEAILTERQYCLHCGCGLTQTQDFCGDCLQHTFEFTQLHAVAGYHPPFPQLIKQLKYHHHLLYADLLGRLLAESLLQRYSETQLQEIDYLIPVPLHKQKQRKRGFNQAQLIMESLIEKLPLNIASTTIVRNKFTNAQEGLTRRQRAVNLKNAFSLDRNTAHHLKGKHIVLIDDVVTTGATINSLCQCLLNDAKVKRIDVWCICRTELQ